MEISMSQRNGLSISMFLALCIMLPLPSAGELECCRCLYIYLDDTPSEQCSCHSSPARRDCSGEDFVPIRKKVATDIGGQLSLAMSKRSNDATEDVCFGATSRSITEDNKEIYALSRDKMPLSDVEASCNWKEINFQNQYGNFTLLKVCKCNTDWCNCDGVEESFIRPPKPEPESSEESINCGNYIGVELMLTATLLITVLACRSYQ